jgi:HPt (histidine-containing phosphotransfer) domain-containing protein
MIDWTLFNAYLGQIDKSFIVEQLIKRFIEDYPGNIARLRIAVANKDYKTVDDIAHPIKTNCKTFGAVTAGELAFQLEMMGKKKTEDKMDVVLPEFERAAEEMIAELKEYCSAP